MANGICGSDIHFFKEGRLGNFIVTGPYVPGHEACGVVSSGGANVDNISPGDHVVIEPGIPCMGCSYCRSGRYNLCRNVVFLSAPPIDGTFCDYVCVRSDFVHPMPDSLPFEQGALVEPAAVAVHAVNRSCIGNGESALVIGAGPIGLLTIQAIKAAGGSEVFCIDRIPSRIEKALKLGADHAARSIDGLGMKDDIADLVFETAGSSAATSALFDHIRPGGRAIQVGWPENNMVPMNIANFLEKELEYIGINRYANAFPAAIQWISDGRMHVEELITHRFSLNEISAAFKFSSENPDKVIKSIVLN
jgi:L-iditol 2-dehydrogenase